MGGDGGVGFADGEGVDTDGFHVILASAQPVITVKYEGALAVHVCRGRIFDTCFTLNGNERDAAVFRNDPLVFYSSRDARRYCGGVVLTDGDGCGAGVTLHLTFGVDAADGEVGTYGYDGP